MLSTGTYAVKCFFWVVALAILSVRMPNWAKTYDDLKPTWGLAFVVAFMGVWAIGWLDQPQTFLYFQF